MDIVELPPAPAQHSPFLQSASEESLAEELNAIDKKILEQQRAMVLDSPSETTGAIAPFTQFSHAGNLEDKKRGHQLIAEGQVGCLLLAGGQGSRLRFSGPKGCYPISVIKNKSLFQLCAEKVLSAGKLAGRPLSLAIMTSNENDEEIKSFFAKNGYFGLAKEQISFFPQSDLPLLNAQGKLFLESPYQLAKGPDGNGRCLEHFVKAGIWSKWHAAGVKFLNVVLIDNPLADPFDAELIGFMERKEVEATLKCTEKKVPDEKVGVLVMTEGSCRVIEYSEMPDVAKKELDKDGQLKHRCANLSLFSFTMDFVQRVGNAEVPMPLHKAWKAVAYLDQEGVTQQSLEPNAWKFEAFIFDVLSQTKKVAALLYPRAECFAPLKNAAGVDSPSTVRESLQKRDIDVITQITGKEAPSGSFELDSDFYYPTADLLQTWKGRTVKGGYVSAKDAI